MLGHLQRLVGQFKDLAFFIIEDRFLAQGTALTEPARTAVQLMGDKVIGLRDRLEGSAGVSRLAPWATPRLCAQGFRGRFSQAVRRWGLATVGAVKCQTIFEFLNLTPQFAHFALQSQQ